jgi:hypothetical protein
MSENALEKERESQVDQALGELIERGRVRIEKVHGLAELVGTQEL